jgi:hypothetical protein
VVLIHVVRQRRPSVSIWINRLRTRGPVATKVVLPNTTSMIPPSTMLAQNMIATSPVRRINTTLPVRVDTGNFTFQALRHLLSKLARNIHPTNMRF